MLRLDQNRAAKVSRITTQFFVCSVICISFQIAYNKTISHTELFNSQYELACSWNSAFCRYIQRNVQIKRCNFYVIRCNRKRLQLKNIYMFQCALFIPKWLLLLSSLHLCVMLWSQLLWWLASYEIFVLLIRLIPAILCSFLFSPSVSLSLSIVFFPVILQKYRKISIR